MKLKFYATLAITSLIAGSLIAQTNTFPASGAVGIGTATPNASSLLEIKSTHRGLLIPRMNQNQRDAIIKPAEGLLIYQTDNNPGFYNYDGSSWGSAAFWEKGDTGTYIYYTVGNVGIGNIAPAYKLDVSGDINTSGVFRIGNAVVLKYVHSNIAIGNNAGTGSGSNNVSIGKGASHSITSGYSNVAIGINALYANTNGNNMVAIGDSALYNQNDASGLWNTAVGSKALYSSVEGFANTANGYQALYSLTSGYDNTAIGIQALHSSTIGAYNTAIGSGALSGNTTGSSNIAIGLGVLGNNAAGEGNTAMGTEAMLYDDGGNYNAAYGYEAMEYSTGSYNIGIGYYALYTSSGYSNVAIGNQALYNNPIQNNIVAVGDSALYHNGGYGSLDGIENVAVGSKALLGNTTGRGNNAFGFQSAYSNTTGSFNTACGMKAGYNVTTGSNNTFLGYNANSGSQGASSNMMALGNGATVTSSNHVVVGNSSVTSIGGYANWSNFSDGRVKKNIKQNVPGLEFINKLQPVTYNLDLDAADKIIDRVEMKDKNGNTIQPTQEELAARKIKEQTVYTGFVAQDVEKAAQSLNYDFSGVDKPDNANTLYGLRYGDFVVPLVKAVQQLSKMNDEKDSIINDLETRLTRIESLIDAQQSTVYSQQSTAISSASLQQNVPNPFSNTTTISYALPQQYSSAKIIITDKNGNMLKQINLPAGRQDISNNKGSVNVDAATLSSGAYQYSLYVDGRLIDTKQMVLNK